MNKQDAIEMLKSMLPKKISYAELIGASSCYRDGGLVYADPEPYAIETAISALEKQIPKKPEEKTLIREDNYRDGTNIPRYDWWCSNCHLETIGTDLMRYCPSCGQAIDWGNEYE